MQYALLINNPERLSSEAYRDTIAQLRAGRTFRGARRFPPGPTTTVRTRDGQTEVYERPQGGALAAFVIAECPSEELAIELGAQVAEATGTAVEVRAVATAGEGGSDKSGVADAPTGPGLTEYAFVINVAEDDRPWPGNPAFDEMMERCGKVLEHLEAGQRFRGTERLARASTAKTVRVNAGRRAIVDGPFSEAREVIGGFILGLCESSEEAVRLAGLIPGAMSGSVEVRETAAG